MPEIAVPYRVETALERVLLNGYIPNIQVSWAKLGIEESLACLEAGANDFGGTLMEESISKAAGAHFGEYVARGEFRAMIRTIGRIPAQRATSYQIRKVFEQQHSMLVSVCGTLRARGVFEEAIEACLQIMNEKQCERPGPRANILRIVSSSQRWAAR